MILQSFTCKLILWLNWHFLVTWILHDIVLRSRSLLQSTFLTESIMIWQQDNMSTKGPWYIKYFFSHFSSNWQFRRWGSYHSQYLIIRQFRYLLQIFPILPWLHSSLHPSLQPSPSSSRRSPPDTPPGSCESQCTKNSNAMVNIFNIYPIGKTI